MKKKWIKIKKLCESGWVSRLDSLGQLKQRSFANPNFIGIEKDFCIKEAL